MATDDVVIGLRLEKKSMVNGLTDIKSGFDLVYGAASKVGQAFNETMKAGAKFNAMQSTSVTNLSLAARETQGLISKMSLLQASNQATALGLGLTSEQFADLAKASTLMARNIGIDANQAIGDLITGMSRNSKEILDNLGIVVSAEQAYKDYAAQLGTTASKLDAVQKNEAFRAATMKEVKRLTEGQTLAVKNAGDAWQQASVAISDTGTALASFAAGDGPLSIAVKGVAGLAMMVRGLTTSLAAAAGATLELDEAMKGFKEPGVAMNGIMPDIMGRGTSALDIINMITPSDELLRKRETRAAQEANRKRGGRRRRKSNEFTAPSFVATAADADEAGMALIMAEVGPMADAAVDSYNAKMATLLRTQEMNIEANNKEYAAFLRKNAAMRESAAAMSALQSEYREFALGGLQDFTSGLWSAADAALMGGDNIGVAMGKMLKATMLSLASQATVKAVFNLAEAAAQWYNPVAVALHLKAAALYGSTAALAGAAGLGMSAAGVGRARPDQEDERTRRDRTGRPSFGARRGSSRDPQKIFVNVYLGNDRSPSAMLLAKQQATAQITQAMRS